MENAESTIDRMHGDWWPLHKLIVFLLLKLTGYLQDMWKYFYKYVKVKKKEEKAKKNLYFTTKGAGTLAADTVKCKIFNQ